MPDLTDFQSTFGTFPNDTTGSSTEDLVNLWQQEANWALDKIASNSHSLWANTRVYPS